MRIPFADIRIGKNMGVWNVDCLDLFPPEPVLIYSGHMCACLPCVTNNKDMRIFMVSSVSLKLGETYIIAKIVNGCIN